MPPDPTHSPDELAVAAARLSAVHRLVEAEGVAAAGLQEVPRNARLLFEHAFAILKQGRVEESVDGLRRALAKQPEDANLRMLLAFALNYDARATASEVAAAHLRYGMVLRSIVGPAMSGGELRRVNHAGPLAPRRRARIGFVSADLYRHSVAYFLEPLLERLPREQLEVVVLNGSPKADEVTARLGALGDRWVDTTDLDHEAFTRVARGLSLDVAVDLSGLTSGHRQAAFARRIAPVQVSYLGYPHASGIDTFDARLADAITDPPGAPNVMGERVIRLAGCFVCYRPPQDAPPIREARGPGGPVVFGCFGNLSKVNRETLRVWGRVLDAVPGSRLVLKNHALGDRFVRGEARPGTRSAIDRMREAGLDLSRVELRQPGADEAAHLDAYNDIDAALDTFPYNGTTTTCEALVMGVPVVTFGGDRHASRVGGSLLRAAGCGDWCGEGEAAFVAKAVEMADSGPRGLPARAALRDRLLASSLCDAQRHAAEFVAALSGAIGSCGAGPR